MNEFVNWRRSGTGEEDDGVTQGHAAGGWSWPGLEWLASEAKGERREAPSQMAVLMLLLLSPTSRR